MKRSCRGTGRGAERRPRLGSRAQPGGCKAWSQRTHPLTHPHSLRSGHCGRPGPASVPPRMWRRSCTYGRGGGHRRQREHMDTIHLLKPVGGRELAGPAIGRLVPLLYSAPSPSPRSLLLLPSSSSSSSLLTPHLRRRSAAWSSATSTRQAVLRDEDSGPRPPPCCSADGDAPSLLWDDAAAAAAAVVVAEGCWGFLR